VGKAWTVTVFLIVAMKNIRLGVANPETWDFFRELYDYFRAQYRTSLFEARKSRMPFFRSRFEKRLLERDVGRLLKENDVVFFEWASNLLALATALPKSAAIVTRLHRWELYKWAHLIRWDAVDRVILVSEAKRREFLQRFPGQNDKVHVIPESINLGRFPFAEREYTGAIGILCHLGPRKRVYELILAFAELVRRNPAFRLHVGGDVHPGHRDYHGALLSLVRRMGLEDTVKFDGFVDNPPEWYRKIDIFVSHSYSEGLQVSPMEAMASGCYVLAHRWEGAEELLPDDCLYFTNCELLAKVEDFGRLSQAGREEQRARMRRIAAEKFDIESNQRKVGQIIDDLIAHP